MSRIGDYAPDDLVSWFGLSERIGGALGAYADAVYRHGRLQPRVREIARMVIAHDNECEVCEHTRIAEGAEIDLDLRPLSQDRVHRLVDALTEEGEAEDQ